MNRQTFRFLTAEELIRDGDARRAAVLAGRVSWGPWRYEPRIRTLTTTQPYPYEIDLDTCTDSAHVLDWIAQVAGKNWKAEIVGDLAIALNELLRLQATMCGAGRNRTLDVRACLSRRRPAGALD
jgi:hypothetical protein